MLETTSRIRPLTARPRGSGEPGRRWTTRIRPAIGYMILCLIALLFLSPLIYMFATSFKPPAEIFSVPPKLFGSEFRWQNYQEALNYMPFLRFMGNGLLVSAAGTALTLVVSAFSGYAFSRQRWRGRNLVFMVFLATLMIPQEVLIVPMFVMMQKVGWVNTFQALIVPWAFTAFGAFLLRQFFLGVPQELDDAARVDGAGTLRTFLLVMLPLARPTMAVLAVFSFISYWNSFLWPLVVINDVNNLGTIPLGLQMFFGQQGNQWHLVMAASVISMAPTLLLLILLQKHLVKGIVTSGFGGR
ncbi:MULTISPECIES: carbohydrate ABC transporter permease [Arthrobacter]|jgi:multiple sugar transport system permease protein|uniref:Multiple sugar transport system permease protein n=2 Tax=Arthrobacter TaxID=1663 RepID=A0AAW8DGV3_9MICC|nr:carbohydrate ABC transporter permease [Arthrobacter bambusae]MDP9906980.1 multiple sugar transport system permease protein [Arthrobacter bambusae]MDQ0130701.1 multiple sugar transport system permease protein [Arthrobacter bambusae]MDQ0182090.1 multiple sugar transport system permease protein [Arthrobacter bambusae]MDQ0239448.1 multiple sugar transport system permease protein [Arthrobacter bambusae]